jgi:hypothetical protein
VLLKKGVRSCCHTFLLTVLLKKRRSCCHGRCVFFYTNEI